MKVLGLKWDTDAPLPWRATKVEGVSWIPLFIEEGQKSGASRGGATVLIRMEPGCGYTPHRHVGTEDVLVLAGGYRDEFGTYRQGDHVHYDPGSAHAPCALGERGRPVDEANPACILYSTVPEGIALLEETNPTREGVPGG